MKTLQIKTAQNINIKFTLADVGQRLAAFFIDNIIKFTYLYTLFNFLNISSTGIKMDNWSMKAFYVILMLPVTFYSLYSEILMNGQTIGKKILKIKVINIEGFKPSITDYLIRWFLRVVDFNFFTLIFIYIYSLNIEESYMYNLIVTIFFIGKSVGFFLIIITKNNQRLGDIISNTIVINLKDETEFSETIIENISAKYIPTYPNVINLSDNDMRLIKDTFTNINKRSDFNTLIKLRSKIEEVANIKSKEKSDKEFIQKILKDYSYYTQND
ncbi:RDD family protein [Tenacibaculum sp. IB213877]|uniref:RDD family protein n=1 Tax=Tenacibaculum sp. IB213877 TaxID=3097351 RepID=UPI002A5A482E|nr:RDD family protein [Tenacibaculum sp. IB213877]MDY0779643.1 RDD family protein [Tenacibaculum sp. IB213877]